MSINKLTLATHADMDKSVNATQPPSKLAKLSIAALLAGISIAAAQDIPVVNIGGTKISLYGFLQLNTVYEDGNSQQSSANPPVKYNWTEIVPKKSSDGSKAQDGEGRFLFNVNQTRIGFNLAGPQAEGGAEVSGKFEADFANNQERNNNGVNGFRIRHSYGQVKFSNIGLTLLAGQTSDLIAPLSAPTLNQGGLRSQGSLGTRRPMIRLTEAIGPIEVAVAATDDRGSDIPVIPGFQGSLKAKIPASWAGEKQNVELILSGHYATEETAADDTTGVKKKDKDGYIAGPTSWSGVASLSLPVISIINLSGETFYGQNLKNYSNGSINIKSSPAPGYVGTGFQSIGGWGAANIKLPAGFALAGGYGVEAIDESRWKEGSPKKNSVIFGNLKYNVAETAFIGFEYANLSTEYAVAKNAEADNGKLNRFELVFNYAFK